MAYAKLCIPAIACAALLSSAALAADTSFDCSKATQKIEKLVCGDDQLAGLDRTLADDFDKAMGQISADDQKELRESQSAWIKSRDACAKEQDQKACTLQSYKTRIAILGAKYGLAPMGTGTFLFTCDDAAKTSFYATFFVTDPATMNLVTRPPMPEQAETLVQGMSASGARYEGKGGIVFWNKGNDAMVEYPAGTEFNCSTDGQPIGE
ncbi:MAG: MliC family protein [Rhizobiales bacterium]|nr:MliC family protein [Hyphomicrobiales bacterium]